MCEETSAVTSLLKSKKINFGSSPIVSNNTVCFSQSSSSALVQSSLSSSLTSSSTNQESRSFDDDIYNFTYDLGNDVVNLEEETCSPHTNSTAYCGSSNRSQCSQLFLSGDFTDFFFFLFLISAKGEYTRNPTEGGAVSFEPVELY